MLIFTADPRLPEGTVIRVPLACKGPRPSGTEAAIAGPTVLAEVVLGLVVVTDVGVNPLEGEKEVTRGRVVPAMGRETGLGLRLLLPRLVTHAVISCEGIALSERTVSMSTRRLAGAVLPMHEERTALLWLLC